MLQTGSEGSQQLLSHCAAIIWFGWTLEVQVFGRSVPPSPQICQEELGKAHAVFGVRAESPHFFTSRDGMRNTRYAFPISLGVLFIYLFLHSFPSFNSFWIFSHIKQTVFLSVEVTEVFDEEQIKQKWVTVLPSAVSQTQTHALNLPEARPCPILLSNRE